MELVAEHFQIEPIFDWNSTFNVDSARNGIPHGVKSNEKVITIQIWFILTSFRKRRRTNHRKNLSTVQHLQHRTNDQKSMVPKMWIIPLDHMQPSPKSVSKLCIILKCSECSETYAK